LALCRILGQEEGWKLLAFEKVSHLREEDVFKFASTEKFTAMLFFAKYRTCYMRLESMTGLITLVTKL
jgi:hypothetical protein